MRTEDVAVLVWGVMAMVAALLLATMTGSTWGMLLAFAASGAAYLFQALQVAGVTLMLLMQASIVLTVASVAISMWS